MEAKNEILENKTQTKEKIKLTAEEKKRKKKEAKEALTLSVMKGDMEKEIMKTWKIIKNKKQRWKSIALERGTPEGREQMNYIWNSYQNAADKKVCSLTEKHFSI